MEEIERRELRCSTHWLERRELGGAYLYSVAFMENMLQNKIILDS